MITNNIKNLEDNIESGINFNKQKDKRLQF